MMLRPAWLPLLALSLPTLGNSLGEIPDSVTQCLSSAVITGTRSPKSLAKTPIYTRLISAEDILHSGATNLQELLQQEMPSVEFTHSLSGHLNLNMGGFSGQNVLILLDGERLAGETMENVDFSRLPLQDLERIEVVKGASSALYGSQAAGGVINLISRGKQKRPWSLQLDGQKGKYQQYRWGGVWDMERAKWGNRLQVQHIHSQGYHLENPEDALLYTNYALQEVKGGRSWNVRNRMHWQIAPQTKVSGRAGYFFRERDYDAGEHHRYRDFSGGLKSEWQGKEGESWEVAYSFDQYDKSDYYFASRLDVRDYSHVQHNWRSLYTRSLHPTLLGSLGGDLLRDYLQSYQFSDGKAHTQWTADAFVQLDWSPSPHWELIGALRTDYSSIERGISPTAKLSTRYHQGAWTLRGGYGGGFRSATLKERFMHFPINELFIIRGHENLKAERSHHFHLSSEWNHAKTHWTAAVGYHLISHRITTSPPGGEMDAKHRLPYVDYINLPRLRCFQAESTLQQQWAFGQQRLQAEFNYAYTHEEVGGGGVLTPYLPARPHSASAQVRFHQRWSKAYSTHWQLSARWFSGISSEEYNTNTGASRLINYPAYALVRLGSLHRIGRAWQFSIAAENLLNYRPHIYYYNSPPTRGLEITLGITLDLHAL